MRVDVRVCVCVEGGGQAGGGDLQTEAGEAGSGGGPAGDEERESPGSHLHR